MRAPSHRAAIVGIAGSVVLLVAPESSAAGKHQEVGLPPDLKFPTADAISVWAEKAYFGGHRKYEFARDSRRVVVIVGQPTSGLVSAEIVVFHRVTDGTYRIMLTRAGILASIQVTEDANGISFSARAAGRPKGRQEPLLLIPWTGVALWPLRLAAEPEIEAVKLEEVSSIAGRSFLAIQAAVPELARFGVKVDDYKVTVLEKGASVVVLLEDPEITVFQRGSTERMPGIEVELSRDGLRVIGSRVSR